MASIFGCPMCTVEDFDQKELECENGYKTVQYIKKEGHVCNGYIQDQTKVMNVEFLHSGILLIFFPLLFLLDRNVAVLRLI
jgi:hypothetical protein